MTLAVHHTVIRESYKHTTGGHSMGYQHQDQMRPSAYSSDMLGHGMKGPGPLPGRQQHSYSSQGHQQSNYSSNFSGNQSSLNGE